MAAAEFEKTKRIRDAASAGARARSTGRPASSKERLDAKPKGGKEILEEMEMIAISKPEWEQQNRQLQAEKAENDRELEKIRAAARDEFRREFNITRAEPVDVTELFYREQSSPGRRRTTSRPD